MKKYIIRISKPAETDIDLIIEYIKNKYYALQTAENFITISFRGLRCWSMVQKAFLFQHQTIY